MKIKVIYDSKYEWLKIPSTFISPTQKVYSFIVVDTGSPNTLLNYFDSRKLNIPFINKSGIVSIGGNKYVSYSYENLKILFKSTEGKPIIEKIPVKILRPSSSKIAEIEDLDVFPNILGLDFLKKYKFSCDLKNNEIFLEKMENEHI
ncbi:hypothetical protein CMI38_00195 [Candidatus Pacearchaeota archaeon]|jgi:hypothetical protein|nr:hypothetical protein [Candidatus Pacearchaeota archaeon]|tara:strand:+ start:988 stop:1428 length:441 start_codon:yes stop_codon:yes gene_type:complete